jgi:biotin operon repressor
MALKPYLRTAIGRETLGPRPHSAREIRERREKILLLMARGYSQGDIARELKIARTTVNRDMKNINEMTNKGWYNLAKVTLPTMFFNCIQGLDEVQKECWKIIENLDNNPAITVAHC